MVWVISSGGVAGSTVAWGGGCGGDNLYKELWKACAGPLVDVPRVGERVFYFPQGDTEQLEASTNVEPKQRAPLFDLPSKILCRVMDIHLRAERDTDEVYAHITLVPEQDQSEPTSPDSYPPEPLTPMVKSFCKVLTASDTNGGFSVHRRHANECLPALDMNQPTPMQELIAKDLHGREWPFKHIFRGHPKRHMFDTGWSRFVNLKRLVAGDSVVFLRGAARELRVGVRRAARQQCTFPPSLITIQSIGVQGAAYRALAQRTLFFVRNKPRTSQFIVGLNKYLDAVNNCFGVGMRFKMRFEGEDCSLRIFTGTIVRVEDLSAHWENSKWRSLRVQWDEAASIPRPERVSPWEIEPFVPTSRGPQPPIEVPNHGCGGNDLYKELWKACAGPLVDVPRVGERVVYFPQGPMEQADSDTDEVYAYITLLPEQDQSEPTSPDSYPPEPLTPMLKSFCKVLTASDIIGGFSVPLRHANECLPALDMNQQSPMQELIAKDLHGAEWRFKHIFRGQPKRHMLATGWSRFVSSKSLVAGDSVVFLRGENGELRVGVRRAAHQQSTMPSSLIPIRGMRLGLQGPASLALAHQTIFSVTYKPRTSQFIVGLNKYLEAVNNCFGVGMRFKMRFEGEDCSLRRCTGTIVGVEDLSSPWKNSKWRSLKVQWDEAASIERPERVSPWAIEPIAPRIRRPQPPIEVPIHETASAAASAVCLLNWVAARLHEGGDGMKTIANSELIMERLLLGLESVYILSIFLVLLKGMGLYKELWKACAGPLVDVPRVGERVFYFPQGHMEQLEASTNQELNQRAPLFNLPSKILCSVMDIQLRAEQDTDEVYARITLVPEQDQSEPTRPVSYPPEPPTPIVYSFCKVLTASDTSPHSGFSVLKKHANECFPALDMNQQIPKQELIAEDLHGREWRFKHIFRGQPRRHLLTTGWSAFVTSKRLVAGDSFVFLRGENGELRVGVRRAARQQFTMPSSEISSPSTHLRDLAAASHAVATRTLFVVSNKPRTSQFIVGLNKYLEAVNKCFGVGMRFTMRFEGEVSPWRSCTGTIVGVEDLSSRWENSKWRSLRVQWDEAASIPRPERVSPWEIEPMTLLFGVDLRNPSNAR
ncbi:hypothetical protein RHGRI_006049 [Rhododendron griersonianum]|uniref:Auxin response factor n=1 Tax=Rhododendron griersonianum TaxID=479676 RepID=A0AAV6LEF0_9ERIC|nr:hypothetical protein RHGRI_006049 [Rhododendron griersonianum]